VAMAIEIMITYLGARNEMMNKCGGREGIACMCDGTLNFILKMAIDVFVCIHFIFLSFL
jgi:hypothetical protein